MYVYAIIMNGNKNHVTRHLGRRVGKGSSVRLRVIDLFLLGSFNFRNRCVGPRLKSDFAVVALVAFALFEQHFRKIKFAMEFNVVVM